MLIAGAVLGALIVILLFVAFFLFAQNRAYVGQVKVLAKEQNDSDAKLAQLAATVKRNESIPYVVNFTEEQINMIAMRVTNKVQVILDAQNEAALKKLN